MNPSTSIESVKQSIRNIPDFPTKGIQFKDITTIIRSAEQFNFIIDHITGKYADKEITKVVGIESRGFISGGALAYKLGAGFIPIRKPGKLPAATFSKSYDLEYGTDTLEIHSDALIEGDVVLLHDDLLATGGTAMAAIDLINCFNVKCIYLSFIIELDFLNARKRIDSSYNVFSLIHF
jgi:adenine phosphoribosyltransferase